MAKTFDPTDPTGPDRDILIRQREVSRQAGREGRDRAKVTRGRADLEVAYDEGANEDQVDGQAPGDAAEIRQSAKGAWKSSSGYLSRGSWSPTLSPPRRPRQAGGFLAGMALYITAITYIRYGPVGWKGWLAAKFINQPMSLGELAGGKAVPTTPKKTT